MIWDLKVTWSQDNSACVQNSSDKELRIIFQVSIDFF